MTAEFEGIAETLLVILAVACIVQVILTGLLLWYARRIVGEMRGAGTPPETVAVTVAPEPPAGVP